MSRQNSGSYPLGYSSHEANRLEQQAAFLNELTEEVFRRAGMRPGMRVLDVGCGMGDVSMAAARIVGASGSVVGVDRDPEGLNRARARASAAQLTNVEFRQAELPHIDANEKFDALVGRLVMIYFPDPAAALRELLRHVAPGGVVSFHEPDLSRISTIPPVPSVAENVDRLNLVFERCGFHPRIGVSLGQVFSAAGLAPSLLGATRMEQGGGGFCPTWLVTTIRSLAPAMVKTQVATEAEIDIDTLDQRIRQEADAANALLLGPLMVGAWAVKPA
ncbi:class I SAM-dependent methyltransferase [Methylocystis sp. JAN1]|uniref:class I SAM-dependent methyltransferase n=1 Tax=Methylocystis sp. JAN1 TaxID=3397211 RepID=UPI003FA27F65